MAPREASWVKSMFEKDCNDGRTFYYCVNEHSVGWWAGQGVGVFLWEGCLGGGDVGQEETQLLFVIVTSYLRALTDPWITCRESFPSLQF